MVKDIEKNLKRWLKRKVKITMEVIVAFLIGSSLSFADTLYIRDGANGIEFSLDNQNWGENPYSENTFENNIYVNKKKIESDKVGVVNNATNVFIINNNIISVNSKNKARGIDNSGTITKLENNGLLEINGTSDATGIGNYKGIIKNLQNNGLITGKGYYIGIENFDGIVLKLENKGIIMSEESDSAIGIDNIMKNDGIIDNLINKGIIDLKGNSNVSGIQNNIGGTIRDLLNQGIIKVEADSKPVKGIANVSNQIENISNEGIIDVIGNSEAIGINFPAKKETKNKGIIKVTSSSNATGIDLGGILENKNENLLNEGIIDVIGSNNGRAIRNIQEINNFINNGILKTKGKGKPIFTAAIFSNSGKINNLEQNGIVFSNRVTIKIPASNTSNIINNGLLIGDSSDFIKNGYDNNGVIFSYDNVNNNYKIQRYKDTGENGIQIGNKTIINAIFTDEQNKNQNNWTATGSESIVLEDNKTDMIYNGITNALKVGGEKTLTNSIVNGYTSAIVFDENGGSLTLDNSIINGGVDETSATIKGSNNIDNLTLTNGTIINGNIDLGNGNDNLTLDDKTQINGDLLGGDGEDTLTFNNSTTKSNDDNINIFGSIHSFENMKIDTNVTFFENTKITGTENITISENGKMIVRVGIEKTNGKLNNHVLNNTGAIVSGDGILSVNLNGNGVGSIIGMGEDSKTQISDDLNIESYSALHIIKKNSNGDLEVLKKEFASPEKYQNLKDIYDSIFASKQDDEFTDTSSEKYGEFLKYLNDIYAGTPYSYSTEISRKTLTMFDEIAISKDLNPDLKSWAIYGGLTHTDGGNKNTFFGKGYYTYDVGSIDIDADIKIYGGYAKAEYGKSENFTTGLIFGGNNSEVSLSNGSKLEGDSFYFGVYGKQKFGNLKLTAGIGVQHGDYKANRKANGYSGITTTREFSENYHDRGFNIYLDGRYSYALGNNFFLEPRMTVDYNRIQQDEVNEKGVLGIEVDSKIFETSSGTVGLDIKKVIPTETLNHELTLGVSYNTFFSGDKEEYLTGRFVGGSNFDMLVGEKADTFSLNGKYEVSTEKGLSFDVRGNYAFEHENSKDEWTVGMGIGYKF